MTKTYSLNFLKETHFALC